MIVKLVCVVVLFTGVSSLCENSYVVICDNLSDIKLNDTSRWRHLLIGSLDRKSEPSSRTLDSSVSYRLFRMTSATIVGQIDRIQSPLNVANVVTIRTLTLFKNNLTEIEDNTFQNVESLREVFLRDNSIRHLGRSVFRNDDLEVVDLSHNHLTSITTCFLHSKVRWIAVNHNRLTHIGRDVLPANLVRLHLDHNLLATLERSTFSNSAGLKELSVKHNRLVAVPDVSPLKAVRFLHFSHNEIEAVARRFDHLEDLEYVDLGHNVIRNVSVEVFSDETDPPVVILSFNRLTDLRFEHPENKTDLVLFGNPWICDCLFDIQKVLVTYEHAKTCDLDFFGKGEFPVCVENGKCGENRVPERDIDAFLNLVKDYNIDQCIFTL